MVEIIHNLRKKAKEERDKRIIKTIFAAISFVFIAYVFTIIIFIGKTEVQQDSMWPSYKSGDKVYYSKRTKDYERNDVVIAFIPTDSACVIKRIVGIPGDTITIKDGFVYINGTQEKELKDLNENLVFNYRFDWEDEWKITEDRGTTSFELKENEYFLLGDNRTESRDSRNYGPITEECLLGRVFKLKRSNLL